MKLINAFRTISSRTVKNVHNYHKEKPKPELDIVIPQSVKNFLSEIVEEHRAKTKAIPQPTVSNAKPSVPLDNEVIDVEHSDAIISEDVIVSVEGESKVEGPSIMSIERFYVENSEETSEENAVSDDSEEYPHNNVILNDTSNTQHISVRITDVIVMIIYWLFGEHHNDAPIWSRIMNMYLYLFKTARSLIMFPFSTKNIKYTNGDFPRSNHKPIAYDVSKTHIVSALLAILLCRKVSTYWLFGEHNSDPPIHSGINL